MPEPILNYELLSVVKTGSAEEIIVGVTNTTAADVNVRTIQMLVPVAADTDTAAIQEAALTKQSGSIAPSVRRADGWSISRLESPPLPNTIAFQAAPPAAGSAIPNGGGRLEFGLSNVIVTNQIGVSRLTVIETLADGTSGTKSFEVRKVDKPTLQYQIFPPSTILEASFSPEPDDDSEADVTIEAFCGGATGVTVEKIQFVVPVAALTAAAAVKEKALTSKPARIQPVAREPNAWSIQLVPDGTGPGTVSFEATPLQGDGAIASGSRIAFRLLDLVVVDQEGLSGIQVIETLAGGSSVGKDAMPIRKVPPALRIDSFNALHRSATGTDGTSAVTTTAVADTANSLVLNWATTGASLIFLDGLSPDDQKKFGVKFGGSETATVAQTSTNKDLHDAEFSVHPKTTTTYTLRARSNRTPAEVVRQLTITVTDQTQTADLHVTGTATMASASVTGHLGVGNRTSTTTASLVSDSMEAGSITADSVTATTTLDVGSINRGVHFSGGKLNVQSDILGLGNSLRFIQQQGVFTNGSTRALGSSAATLAGIKPDLTAQDSLRVPEANLFKTGISIPSNEAVVAHWCVPLSNFPDVDRVVCFTTLTEPAQGLLEVAVAILNAHDAFAIRVAIFVITALSTARPTELLQ